ncbi:MAG: type I restriction-modification system subunit M N-terminal domain-containing protein [Methanosarcinales archaeon]|jgi:type I restriction enzyme M protein|nr:type I restriction-modification system subunit M N-terminal domain-containing protein [Methanosarcinales archaeon]
MAKNNADIGFEKQILDAACILRGNIDAAEYKSFALLQQPKKSPNTIIF